MLKGAGDYIAATTTNDLFKLKFLPEMKTVFEHVLKIGRYWAGDRIMELKEPPNDDFNNWHNGRFLAERSSDLMWGRIILRSAQSESGLASTTAKAALLDEVGQDGWTLEDWEEIEARVALNEGRIFGATTLYNLGWLKSEIYDKWLDGDKSIEISQFSSLVNPAFPPKEFERLKDKMQDWRFSMSYLGEFAKPATLIYKDFSNLMLVDDFEIPQDWQRVVGVDFGGANTATIYAALNPEDKRWYLYKETLEGGLSTDQHVRRQKEYLEGTDYEVVGGSKSEGQQRLDWSVAGLEVYEPPISDVEAGIDRVIQIIKQDQLRVFRSLKGLRDELGSYQRKADSSGNPTDEILNKRHFHRLDAVRYLFSFVVEGLGEIEIIHLGRMQ